MMHNENEMGLRLVQECNRTMINDCLYPDRYPNIIFLRYFSGLRKD